MTKFTKNAELEAMEKMLICKLCGGSMVIYDDGIACLNCEKKIQSPHPFTIKEFKKALPKKVSSTPKSQTTKSDARVRFAMSKQFKSLSGQLTLMKNRNDDDQD